MDKLNDAVAVERSNVVILETFIPILEANGDKKITKAIATKLEKALAGQGYRVWYGLQYDWRRISIQHESIKDYDKRFTIDFTQPQDFFVVKTEAESIAKTLETCRAQLGATKSRIETLLFEIANYQEIERDYKEIAKLQKKLIADFKKKWGHEVSYGLNLSYTLREALEAITGEKIGL